MKNATQYKHNLCTGANAIALATGSIAKAMRKTNAPIDHDNVRGQDVTNESIAAYVAAGLMKRMGGAK